MNNEKCKIWYENSYKIEGFCAQRRYPNEELCRFMGRNFFDKKNIERHCIKILEVGCGSCSNLWMIAQEGFDAYGIDLSKSALSLGEKMLAMHGVEGTLVEADMTEIPFENDMFDVVVDVFSSNCLTEMDYCKYTKEIYRILKTKGVYFSYTPSKGSDEFLAATDAEKIDDSTLLGAKSGYAFEGNNYPFRFMSDKDLDKRFKKTDWEVKYCEKVGRTYQREKEYFEFLVFEVQKI